jgi:hypothetical protein
MKRDRWHVRYGLLLVAALIIWGGYLGLRGPDWLVSMRQENIKPGEVDWGWDSTPRKACTFGSFQVLEVSDR